ncbi:unnamed protein product, partial [Adineta steineri]
MSTDKPDLQEGQPHDLILSTAEEVIQTQEESKKNKKKKCRGNRKLQRFRAKLKRQGLNNEAITTVINTYNNPSRPEEEENVQNIDVNVQDFIELHQQAQEEVHGMVQEMATKRKRELRGGVTTSISQVSIAQPLTKRQRSTTIIDLTQVKTNSKKSADKIKPNYLNTSDHIFKQMLLKALEGVENTIQSLDTPEKLEYARTYAQLVNDLFYFRLKQDYWDHYYKIATSTSIWSLELSKQIIKENNLNRIYFMTLNNVQKRRQMIIEELKQSENELDKHKQLLTDQFIDLKKLSMVIPAFVRKGQYKLSADFQRRKQLLQLDANDYCLVQAFYKLNPTEDQIRSAKIIWQATFDKQHMEEYVAILKQRIYTKRLPASFGILDHSIDNAEQMLKQLVLHADKRATLSSRRLKTIAQFKYDLLTLEITTSEELIRSHTNIIANEKKKLTDSVTTTTTTAQVPLPKSLVSVLNAIAARQSNIIQRAQLITKQNHILPSSPIIEVDSSLSSKQLAFLANGPKYVPTCQSRFSHSNIDVIIKQEYETIIKSFKNTLTDNCLSISDQRAKEFFMSIENLLCQLQTQSVSHRLSTRIRHDDKLIRSIQRIQKQENIVLRRTDKSKVFHLGSTESYHQKSMEYMQKTKAYKEITSGINPCMDHLHQVLTFINPLLQKKIIDLKLWKQWMHPNIETIELAHLYFIPKPHK